MANSVASNQEADSRVSFHRCGDDALGFANAATLGSDEGANYLVLVSLVYVPCPSLLSGLLFTASVHC